MDGMVKYMFKIWRKRILDIIFIIMFNIGYFKLWEDLLQVEDFQLGFIQVKYNYCRFFIIFQSLDIR